MKLAIDSKCEDAMEEVKTVLPANDVSACNERQAWKEQPTPPRHSENYKLLYLSLTPFSNHSLTYCLLGKHETVCRRSTDSFQRWTSMLKHNSGFTMKSASTLSARLWLQNKACYILVIVGIGRIRAGISILRVQCKHTGDARHPPIYPSRLTRTSTTFCC